MVILLKLLNYFLKININPQRDAETMTQRS